MLKNFSRILVNVQGINFKKMSRAYQCKNEQSMCMLYFSSFETNKLEVNFRGWYRKRKQFNKATGNVSL